MPLRTGVGKTPCRHASSGRAAGRDTHFRDKIARASAWRRRSTVILRFGSDNTRMRVTTGTPKVLGFCLLMFWGTLAEAQNALPPQGLTAGYVGSMVCQPCHPAIYARWSKTPMANVVRDPKIHPEAILPELSKPRSARYIQAGRYRLCLRLDMEAAVFSEGRR